MKWNRDKVDARPDPSAFELADELCAINLEPVQIQANRIEMPCMTAPGTVRWQLQFIHAGKRAIVHRGVGSSPLYEFFELSQLVNANRCLNVAKVVLKSMSENVVVPVSV